MSLPVRPVLATGLLLGLVGNFMVRADGAPGLNFTLMFLLLAVAVVGLARRTGRELSREAVGLLGAGVLLGTAFVLRASGPLHFFSFVAVALCFAMPALRAGAPWLAGSGVGRMVEAVASAVANAGLGSLRLLGAARQSEAPVVERGRVWPVLRGVLLALPLLLVFGGLLAGADPFFAELLRDVFRVDYEELFSHVFVTGVLAWLACGYLGGFLSGKGIGAYLEWPGRRPQLGLVELAVALLLVDLLFGLFVGVQFRYLFGGSALVEVTPGLTYAEYVNEGFGQLALACTLVLPLLLAADWALDARVDRRAFRGLGGLMLLLLAVVIGSAFQRVVIYEQAYGWTETRLYGAYWLGWITLVAAWFAATVLRGRRAQFALPVLLSALAGVALLGVGNPDAFIARHNLERARATQRPVDISYLMSLGADAVPPVLGALGELPIEDQGVVACRLLERFGPQSEGNRGWRAWNASIARAQGLVAGREAELRGVLADPRVAECDSVGR